MTPFDQTLLSLVSSTSPRPQGVCLSIVFFVLTFCQVVIWDLCSGINLQGLVAYEKHVRLWQSVVTFLARLSCLRESGWGASLKIEWVASRELFTWVSTFLSVLNLWPHCLSFAFDHLPPEWWIVNICSWNIYLLMQHEITHTANTIMVDLVEGLSFL